MSQIILNFILILIFSLSIFNQIHLVRTNVPNDNFYDLLGINKDADNREIRKAFKKLALKLHPDKNKVTKPFQNNMLIIFKKMFYLFRMIQKHMINSLELIELMKYLRMMRQEKYMMFMVKKD